MRDRWAFDSLEQARAAFARVGELESEAVAWVDQNALFELGIAGGDSAWRVHAESMMAGAARHGWVRDRSPGIKSHVVWNRSDDRS